MDKTPSKVEVLKEALTAEKLTIEEMAELGKWLITQSLGEAIKELGANLLKAMDESDKKQFGKGN